MVYLQLVEDVRLFGDNLQRIKFNVEKNQIEPFKKLANKLPFYSAKKILTKATTN